MKVIKLIEVKLTPQQLLDRFYEYNGFNKDGEGWIVCGETYSIKDELKDLGGKFNGNIKHWIIPVDDKKYTTIWVKADLLFDRNPSTGVLDYRYPKAPTQGLMTQIQGADNTASQQANKEKNPSGVTSKYMGKPGQRITINVKSIELKRKFISEYTGQDAGLYEIVDEDGNYYVWYASYLLPDISNVKSLTGTIKDYKEFNGIQQTVLNRCTLSDKPSWSIKNRPVAQQSEQNSNVQAQETKPVASEVPNGQEKMPTFDFDMDIFN